MPNAVKAVDRPHPRSMRIPRIPVVERITPLRQVCLRALGMGGADSSHCEGCNPAGDSNHFPLSLLLQWLSYWLPPSLHRKSHTWVSQSSYSPTLPLLPQDSNSKSETRTYSWKSLPRPPKKSFDCNMLINTEPAPSFLKAGAYHKQSVDYSRACQPIVSGQTVQLNSC